LGYPNVLLTGVQSKETRKDCMISRREVRRTGVRQHNVLSPHIVGA
jgi:hypothetical protein